VGIGCTFPTGVAAPILLENLYAITGKVHPTRPIQRFQALLAAMLQDVMTLCGVRHAS
jgi:hypothetical protein